MTDDGRCIVQLLFFFDVHSIGIQLADELLIGEHGFLGYGLFRGRTRTVSLTTLLHLLDTLHQLITSQRNSLAILLHMEMEIQTVNVNWVWSGEV